MLPSLLAATTCAVILVSDPLEVPARMADPSVSVAVGTNVTPTSFRSRNFSTSTHLLVFASDGSSERVVVELPAGGSVKYEFAPEALAGMKLEVVAVDGTMLRPGGAHSLALPVDAPDMTLWTVPEASKLYTWMQLGCEMTLLDPHGSLLPQGSDGGCTEAMTAPTHVPVAVPRTTIGAGDAQFTPM